MTSNEVQELLDVDEHTMHAYVRAGKLEILLSPWGTFYHEDGVLRLARRLRWQERMV